MHRLAIALLLASCATAPVTAPPATPSSEPPPPARQNPSPMADTTRAHQRVERRETAGRRFVIDDVLPKPVDVLVTPSAESSDAVDLVVHFHGAAWLPLQSAEAT